MAPARARRVGAKAAPSSSGTTLLNSTAGGEYYLKEGLEGVKHTKYRGPRSFANEIDKKTEEALAGESGQYLVFRPVTQKQLEKIDQIRDTKYKGLRFTYLNNQQALVVKIIIGATHEIAHRMFSRGILEKAIQMGFHKKLVDMGSTTLRALGGWKEGDTAFKPVEFRPQKNAWPTLVLECGVSESLPRLVTDSRWWLENSLGEVKIVILISVSEPNQSFHIEKWEAVTETRRITRANPGGVKVTPVKVHELDIVDGVVTGAQLHLGFEKMMLRQPDGQEGDIVFDVEELEEYATLVWSSTQ